MLPRSNAAVPPAKTCLRVGSLMSASSDIPFSPVLEDSAARCIHLLSSIGELSDGPFLGQFGSSEYSADEFTWVVKPGLRQEHPCCCRQAVNSLRPTFCRLFLLALFFFGLPSAHGSSSPDAGGVPEAQINPAPVRVNVIEGDDVRFLRLSGIEGLSQNRVTQIVQDDQGFMWLATQHGVDRYDGYQFRTFKNDPRQTNSLCGVFMLALFKDRSGTLWMGCEYGLDRFDPSTETFVHYQITSDTLP